MDANGELYQYFHDGLGSITMICDSTGSYQNLYVYDDFGNFRMMEEAGSVPNSYYYTGQELDESPSGLYNLRARYYAAGIGRFTQEDPVFEDIVRHELLPFWEYDYIYGSCISTGGCGSGNNRPIAPQDNNPYVYCIGNPVNMIDPSGLLGRYGYWCGRGWTGGKEKYLDDMTKEERKHLLQPKDDKDYCCMKHDYCYYYCRKDKNHPSWGGCQLGCDILWFRCSKLNK